MSRRVVLAALVLLVVPVSADALAPMSPTAGQSIASSHPLFRWSLDGHEASAIVVSRAQRTTPEGEFFDEDRETSGTLDATATVWQPTSPVPAGTYWWAVQWHAPDYSEDGYTLPQPFTIRPSVRGVRVAVQQHGSIDNVTARVSWWSNTRTTRTSCRLYRGRRIVSRDADASTYPTVAGRNTETCDLSANERWDGERMRLVVDVRGGGVKRSASVRFRAR